MAINIVKSELIQSTKESINSQIDKKIVDEVINTFLETIASAIKNGESVKIENFGTFSPYIRNAHIGKCISDGETKMIPESICIGFKPSKKLKE